MFAWILELIFAVFGLGIVIVSLVWARKATSFPIEFAVGKGGVAVRTNYIGGGLIIGFVVFLASVYFIYKGYDEKVDDLQKKYDALDRIVSGSIAIDMNATLFFPRNDLVVLKEVRVAIQHKGILESKRLDPKDGFEKNAKLVTITGLRSGDILQVSATTDKSKYLSKQIIMPIANIEMSPE